MEIFNQGERVRRFHIYDKHDGSYEDFMNIAEDCELLIEYCQQVIDIIDKHVPTILEKIRECEEHMQKFKEIINQRV